MDCPRFPVPPLEPTRFDMSWCRGVASCGGGGDGDVFVEKFSL